MLEKDTQKVILEYLRLKKIFHWRNNTGAFLAERKGKQNFIRYGAPGSPDIFVLRDGILFGFEVKSDKGKQSDLQKEFEQQMTQNGGWYYVVRSLDEVIKILKEKHAP